MNNCLDQKDCDLLIDKHLTIKIQKTLVDIQLALSSNHNTVTTDDVTASVDDTHWRIDFSREVGQINELAKLLGINLCNDPRCIRGNSDL